MVQTKMKSENELTIKYEVWKDGFRRVVARQSGRIVTYRKLKGSGISKKDEFTSIFKKNKTFHPNIRKNKRTKIIEKFRFSEPATKLQTKEDGTKETYEQAIQRLKTSKTLSNRPSETHAYIVTGEYIRGNQVIVISSTSGQAGGITEITKNAKEMKELAWERFFKAVSNQTSNGNYSDAEIGLQNIGQVVNIREGWKSYIPIKKRK